MELVNSYLFLCLCILFVHYTFVYFLLRIYLLNCYVIYPLLSSHTATNAKVALFLLCGTVTNDQEGKTRIKRVVACFRKRDPF
jgi:hypothetical protein